MRRCIIRADASTRIGGGHIVRCMALAGALGEAGWRCAFASHKGSDETVPALSRLGHEVGWLDCHEKVEAAQLRDIWPEGCDLLVIDHYGRNARFESACRDWAKRILVIDDLADRPHDCDFLLDQTFGRTPAAYAGLTPKDCQLVLGTSYALLRPAFLRLRATSLARRERCPTVRRVLVSYGLMDNHGLCRKALAALVEAGFKGRVDVMIGSNAPGLGKLVRAGEDAPLEVHIHRDTDDAAVLLARADLALGAGGTTSWERCCLGLPAVVTVAANNQWIIAEALMRAGAVVLTGDDAGSMTAATRCLLEDHPRRRRMALAAQAVCDGQGAERLIEVVSR